MCLSYFQLFSAITCVGVLSRRLCKKEAGKFRVSRFEFPANFEYSAVENSKEN